MNEYEFKKGQTIVFTNNIKSGYELNYKLLIPAFTPCVITNINNSHVTVLYKNKFYKLRNIKNRMVPHGNLSKAIFGK